MKAIVRTCEPDRGAQLRRELAEGSPKEIVNDPRVMAAYLGDSVAVKA